MPNFKDYKKKYAGDRFFQEVFLDEDYKSAKEYLTVVDIGALAGEFSFYMYEGAKVIYAIEPFSESYKELEENIKGFGFDKVKPFRLALSDYNGEGYMVSGGRGGNVLLKESGTSKTEKVRVKTLATFMKDEKINHIDILKIDIENGEKNVFESEDFEEVADKIDFIIGEHLEGLQTLFEGYGFKAKNVGRNITYER